MKNKEFIEKLTRPFEALKWVPVGGGAYAPYITTDMIFHRLNEVMPGCYEVDIRHNLDSIMVVLTIHYPEGQTRSYTALGTFNGKLKTEEDKEQAKCTNGVKKAFEYAGYTQCEELGTQKPSGKAYSYMQSVKNDEIKRNAYMNKLSLGNPKKYKVPDEIAKEPQKQTASKEDLIKGLPESLQQYIAGELFSLEELELLLKNIASAEKKQDNARKDKWVNAFIEKGKTRAIQESEEPVTKDIDPKDLPF